MREEKGIEGKLLAKVFFGRVLLYKFNHFVCVVLAGFHFDTYFLMAMKIVFFFAFAII